MIGICTRYSCHEATYAAIRLADWAMAHGQEVSLFTMTEKPSAVSAQWDHQVVINKRDMTFRAWVATCDKVIWTTLPHPQQLSWVSNAKGLPTYLFILWHTILPEDQGIMSAATQCICPNYATKELLMAWGLSNAIVTPWDCGEPLFQKSPGVPLPRVLLPLYDGNARRTEMTAIELAGRAMYRNAGVQFTVAYNSSTLAPSGRRRLRQLKKMFGPRLVLRRNITPREQPLLYQQHDLTLWPTHYESTGAAGVLSITMGTPVLAFNFRPITEFLHDKNSILVPTAREYICETGAVLAVPDYETMDNMLYQAVADVEYLQELNKTVLSGLLERRRVFEQQLSNILL